MATPYDNLGTWGQGIGAIGEIGTGIFSAITGGRDAAEIARIQKEEANTELQMNEVRRDAVRVSSERAGMNALRGMQSGAAMGLAAGINQGGGGALTSSGVQGGMQTVAGAGNVNRQGIYEGFRRTSEMFDLTDHLSMLKMQMADAQTKSATDSAWGKLFGGISGSLGDLGKLASIGLPMLAV